MSGDNQPIRRWEPLQRRDNDPAWVANPQQVAAYAAIGSPPDDEVWTNNRYQVRVSYVPLEGESKGSREGLMHLSINSHLRSTLRNWRHLQQIKNEIAGEDRWAVEVFPPEDHLTDTSNQYHLWVLPAGTDPGFGFRGRNVSTDEDVEAFNAADHKGRQEPWEPGLTTGRRPSDRSLSSHPSGGLLGLFGPKP